MKINYLWFELSYGFNNFIWILSAMSVDDRNYSFHKYLINQLWNFQSDFLAFHFPPFVCFCICIHCIHPDMCILCMCVVYFHDIYFLFVIRRYFSSGIFWVFRDEIINKMEHPDGVVYYLTFQENHSAERKSVYTQRIPLLLTLHFKTTFSKKKKFLLWAFSVQSF